MQERKGREGKEKGWSGGEKEEGKEEIYNRRRTDKGGEERGGPGYILLMQ